MKRQAATASQGQWWRFSIYEIGHDGCIRPGAGASLERYDPWETFRESRSLTVGQGPKAAQPPYQSLMKLVHELEYRPGSKRYPDCLTPESLTRIQEWCCAHGPLGVLLSQWEEIALAPKKRDKDGFVQRRYSRGAGQAIQVLESSGDVEQNQPRVVIHGVGDFNLREELPGQTWYRFFPSVEFGERDRYAYPEPYSDEFCSLYSERVIDFCRAARFLAGAMMHLQKLSQPSVADPELAHEQALQAINALRRPVTSILDIDEAGNPQVHWEAPSLLASFAEMYVQDWLFGRPALTCECCGVAFVSSAHQAQFCSLSCRYRGQKRRLRQQIKEAKELHAQGKKAREIATLLDQKPKVVAGWLAKR